SESRSAAGRRSTLFLTRMHGFLSASSSFRTISTWASYSADNKLLTSETCSTNAAHYTSSSVARKAETSVCGRLRMNPTVSDISTFHREGSVTARMVGSRVANIFDEARTADWVSALNKVDLPALV